MKKMNEEMNNVILNENYLDDCNVYFYDFVGYKYTFRFTSKGEEKTVVVKVVEDDCIHLVLNGEYLLLPEGSFKECNDVDDCGVVIGKNVIKDHDGEVQMSFTNDFSESVAPIIVLTKEWEYKSFKDEELTWTLNLCANQGLCVSQYEFWDVPKTDFADIKKMILEKDYDKLEDYRFEHGSFDYREVLDLWGDKENELISVEILDENNAEVVSEPFVIQENDVVDYPSMKMSMVVDKDNHPQYLFFISDSVKRSYATFRVPKNFSVYGMRFLCHDKIPYSTLYCDRFGDTVTSIGSFRYGGNFFSCDAIYDAGTYGDVTYFLYEWDETHRRYKEVCSCR